MQILPAELADCLETLEEIAIAGCDTFLRAGGESFTQIPCLNDQAPYVDFLRGRVRTWLAASFLRTPNRGTADDAKMIESPHLGSYSLGP